RGRLRVLERDLLALVLAREVGELLPRALLELLEPFGGHDAVRRPRQAEDVVRGPPVRVETGLALAGALGRDSVEPTQTLDVVVDVVADAAGVHPLGLEQGPDRRVLVVDRRVVAFDLDELGHRPARDRFAFAELPVLDPTV